MDSEHSNSEGFHEVDKSKDKMWFVNHLDAVRSQKHIAQYKEQSFSFLNLKEGDKALDVGCGTGEDVVSIARIVGSEGRAVGIDNSETMISEARKRATSLNISNLDFLVGSAYRIDFPDGTFNACRADRVFQHLQDPKKALNEIIRVTRNGSGTIAIHDPDWDTLVLDSKFKETTRRILRVRSDSIRNGWMGRQLYGMFKEAGLNDVTTIELPKVVSDYDIPRHLTELEQLGKSSVQRRLIKSNDFEDWLSDLRRKHKMGQFFMSVTSYTVVGTRPA